MVLDHGSSEVFGLLKNIDFVSILKKVKKILKNIKFGLQTHFRMENILRTIQIDCLNFKNKDEDVRLIGTCYNFKIVTLLSLGIQTNTTEHLCWNLN